MTEMVYDLASATSATAHWTQLLLDSNYLTDPERQALVNAWDEYMRLVYAIEQRVALDHPDKTNLEDCINEPRKHQKPGSPKRTRAKRNPANG